MPKIPSSFDIKSANLPLLQLVLKTADLTVVAAEFKKRYGGTAFFEQDPVVIELSKLPPDAAPIDFKALKRLLRPYKLVPIAFSGETQEQAEAAQAAGLVRAPDAQVALAPEPPAPAPEPVSLLPVATPRPAAELLPPMIVERPVRGGQQVYARNRDLIILATVNAGAEVISDGNIHVYGQLRGKAMAGARGDRTARIFAAQLNAELVGVAGTYRTSEKPLPIEVAGKSAQVLLSGETLVMTPLGG